MDYLFPIFSSSALTLFLIWLMKNLIITRLTKTVQFEFDEKLENIRAEFRRSEEMLKADLRAKENEISVLRNGALSALANTQTSLTKRQLEAIDQIWSSVINLANAKFISHFMTGINFTEAAKRSPNNPKLRQMLDRFGSDFDPKKLDLSGAEKARPFISQLAWALFVAYKSIILSAASRFEAIRLGAGDIKVWDEKALANIIKAALPDREPIITSNNTNFFHLYLEEIEAKLLEELHKSFAGSEVYQKSLESAAKIIEASNQLLNSEN